VAGQHGLFLLAEDGHFFHVIGPAEHGQHTDN
jgi:hypothetical protein